MSTDTAGTARGGTTMDGTTRLRALLERATQTPWRQDCSEITVVGSAMGVDGGETVIAECTLPDCAEVADEDREEQEERNAALIVAAVNALPGLLDRVERAEADDALLDAAGRRILNLTAERHAERGRAERAEARVAELEAILDGRTTPPTDAEIEAHNGAWLTRWQDGAIEVHAYIRAPQLRVPNVPQRSRWWPLDADGRPCAWPAEVSRG